MPSSREFFIALQEFINKQDSITIYYETAGKTSSFPYGVISDPNESLLKYGNLVYFDINIWSNEPNIGNDLEEKLESLINLLDGKIFIEQKAVIYFENQRPISDPEFELIKKKLSFSVRIF